MAGAQLQPDAARAARRSGGKQALRLVQRLVRRRLQTAPGLRQGRQAAACQRAQGRTGGHAKHVLHIEGSIAPLQGGAAEIGGPCAPAEAVAGGIKGETRHRLRGRGQQGGQQTRGQGRRQIDDMARRGFPPDALHPFQQQGRRLVPAFSRPLAVEPAQQLAARQGPAPGKVPQQGQGRSKIVQTENARPQTGPPAIFQQGLALQQVSETGKVEQKDVDSHVRGTDSHGSRRGAADAARRLPSAEAGGDASGASA